MQKELKFPEPPEDYQPPYVAYKVGDMVAFHTGPGSFIENDSYVGTIVAIQCKPQEAQDYEWRYIIRFGEFNHKSELEEGLVPIKMGNIFQKL